MKSNSNLSLVGKSKHVVAPLLITALTLTQIGCGSGSLSGTDSEASQGAAATSGYDGETLFRGVFLGTGPVADQLPELRSTALAESASRLTKEQLATELEGAASRMRVAGTNSDAVDHISTMAADLRSGDVSPGELLTARRNVEAASGDRIVARIRAADPTFFDRFAAALQSGDHVRVQTAIEEGGRALLDAASVEGVLPGHVVPETQCIAVVIVVLLFWVVVAFTNGHGESDLQRAELVDAIATRFAR